MTEHKIATREEWIAAREQLLVREKEHTRLGDELAQQRRELPWVPVEKEYRFDTDDGEKAPRRAFRGAIPAARLPLHVRPQLRGRLPGEFVDCRLRRRRRPAPARAGRDDALRLTSAAGEAAGIQAPHGLELSLGLGRSHRVQLRPRLLVHRGTSPRGRGADEGDRARAPGLEVRNGDGTTADRRAQRPLVGHRRRGLPHREPRVQQLRQGRRRPSTTPTRRPGVDWSLSWATTRSSTAHRKAATRARHGSSGSAGTTSTRPRDGSGWTAYGMFDSGGPRRFRLQNTTPAIVAASPSPRASAIQPHGVSLSDGVGSAAIVSAGLVSGVVAVVGARRRRGFARRGRSLGFRQPSQRNAERDEGPAQGGLVLRRSTGRVGGDRGRRRRLGRRRVGRLRLDLRGRGCRVGRHGLDHGGGLGLRRRRGLGDGRWRRRRRRGRRFGRAWTRRQRQRPCRQGHAAQRRKSRAVASATTKEVARNRGDNEQWRDAPSVAAHARRREVVRGIQTASLGASDSLATSVSLAPASDAAGIGEWHAGSRSRWPRVRLAAPVHFYF